MCNGNVGVLQHRINVFRPLRKNLIRFAERTMKIVLEIKRKVATLSPDCNADCPICKIPSCFTSSSTANIFVMGVVSLMATTNRGLSTWQMSTFLLASGDSYFYSNRCWSINLS